MISAAEQDASFYQTVHLLLGGSIPTTPDTDLAVGSRHEAPGERSCDRRTFGRHSFTCPQLIAPYDGQTMPPQSAFELVDCYDISPSGFSFVTDAIPDYQHLVIALGTVPFSFFSAEILHVQRLENEPGEPIRVGCRLLKRIGGKGTPLG